MDTSFVVHALGALAHDRRLAIFRALIAAGTRGLAAGDISQRLGICPSSLSFHLKDLSNANLVKGRQEGHFVYYSANFETMTGLIGFLTENCCAGDGGGDDGSK
jgi:ArsR family transcriptional regulator, arsenate/arsenite/antimonite-responsive transcriptional repressor